MLALQIELDISEVVDVEDDRPNAVLPDLWLGHVEADERLRIDRGSQIVQRHAEREMRRRG
jgi:hypothetical protein